MHKDPKTSKTLIGLRESVDNIDAELVHLLAERFKYTKQIGDLKALEHLPAEDPNREAEQFSRIRTLAERENLNPIFAQNLLKFIIEEVVKHHNSAAQNYKKSLTRRAMD